MAPMVFTEFTSFPGGQHILLCSTQSSTRPSGDSSTSRYSVHLAQGFGDLGSCQHQPMAPASHHPASCLKSVVALIGSAVVEAAAAAAAVARPAGPVVVELELPRPQVEVEASMKPTVNQTTQNPKEPFRHGKARMAPVPLLELLVRLVPVQCQLSLAAPRQPVLHNSSRIARSTQRIPCSTSSSLSIAPESNVLARPRAAEELVAVPPAPRRAGAQVHAAHVEPWPPGAAELLSPPLLSPLQHSLASRPSQPWLFWQQPSSQAQKRRAAEQSPEAFGAGQLLHGKLQRIPPKCHNST
mmetsp:Transcript_20933/g.46047  ORF Transcript_20933/g.46047 Transcript_20933/m.46047 type:complete len:298 (+) Transcript_20933:41-934(+)